ncbi:hypothetical protein HYS49_00040 [Candidatus Woesearchaeota archaeon]|nr:hypothetical protein [Candidatus Woesearchaeota archaeon]
MGKISRDTPLAELTFRRYEKPSVNERELVRKFCLSVGLLQPGDSRDVVVDVLHVLLKARQRKEELHSEEIKNLVMDERKRSGLPMLGVASSNVRRQLKRIKDLHLIETNANLYRITEWADLSELFEEKVHNFLLKSVLGRVREYVKRIDEEFGGKEKFAGKKGMPEREMNAEKSIFGKIIP